MSIVVERHFGVSAPAESVLEYLRDFGHTMEWDPATRRTVRVDQGPIQVGSSWHNESRVLGVTTELTYTLCADEGGRLVFIGRSEGASATATMTVQPMGLGCAVTYHLDLERHGVVKLATPVMKIEYEKLGTVTAQRLAEVLGRRSAQAF
ncbi:SRPBCC family protein [Actinoplanes sp. NPDC051633]|uniref:SRPBCC family protein n=1 Tax=Actinoplanes sp. NPDC051633 TaxID=3155670 RepID=UPI00343D3FA1